MAFTASLIPNTSPGNSWNNKKKVVDICWGLTGVECGHPCQRCESPGTPRTGRPVELARVSLILLQGGRGCSSGHDAYQAFLKDVT